MSRTTTDNSTTSPSMGGLLWLDNPSSPPVAPGTGASISRRRSGPRRRNPRNPARQARAPHSRRWAFIAGSGGGPQTGQADEKGAAARRRPKPGREAYSPYLERQGEGAALPQMRPYRPPGAGAQASQGGEKGPAA